MVNQTEKTDIYSGLDEKAELLFQYQSVMYSFSLFAHDYGTGIVMSEVEAHTLNYINAEPGLIATRLVELTDRTKSAVSQTLRQLEKQGLIRREINPLNKREYLIFVTEIGAKTCAAHRNYDREGVTNQINSLLESCTPEEIESFFKVLRCRIAHFKRVNAELRKIIPPNRKRPLLKPNFKTC